MTWHIVERFVTHILMSGSVYLAAYFILDWCRQHYPYWDSRIAPALVAAGFLGWRKAYDVANGQPEIKAYTDYASWVVGLGLAAWVLYRYTKDQK